MNIYMPDYYNDFKCNPTECKHNCCIGWEIDIDEKTLLKYAKLTDELGDKIRSSISIGEEGAHFKLNKNDSCPFLNSDNLCDIIINAGEDMLCQICTDHPRYRNYYNDYIELGLGLCCEECGKIILNRKTPSYFLGQEENDSFFKLKKKIIDIANSTEKDITEKIRELLSYSECSYDLLDFDYWKNVYLELENLDSKWQNILKLSYSNYSKSSVEEWNLPLSQLLTYFIMRHFTDENIKEMVAFSALSVYLIMEIFFSSNDLSMDNLIEISRMYSSEIEYSENNIDELLFEIDINLKG